MHGHSVENGVGVHAFKTERETRKHFSSSTYIIGEVELWGQVAEHAHGYRAQYGAIRSLVDGPYSQLQTLRRVYGVDTKHAITMPLETDGSSSGGPVLLGTIVAACLLAFILLTTKYVPGPPTASPYYGGYSGLR